MGDLNIQDGNLIVGEIVEQGRMAGKIELNLPNYEVWFYIDLSEAKQIVDHLNNQINGTLGS